MRRIQVVVGLAVVLAFPFFFLETGCYRFSPQDAKTERLFQALQNPDDEILFYVVEKLGRSGSKRATDALLSALNSAHPFYGSFMATGLGFVNDDRATPALLQALRSGDRQLQYSAAMALARRRDSAALETLLSLIKNPSPTTRRNTIYALRMMRDPRVFDALRNALKDSDGEVRAAALRGIALSADPRALEVLYSALNENAGVSSSAAEYLALMPDNSGISALIKAFENPDLPLTNAFHALKRNSLKPEALINFLLDKLKLGPDALRIRAAEGLAAFEDDRVIDALMLETADPNPMVRSSAMRSLHSLNNDRADAFILMHAKNRSSNLHALAAQAVCDRMDPRNSLLISGFLKEQDVHIQFSAVRALISMADPQTIPAIRAAAARKNKNWIQEHILLALGKTLGEAEDPDALEVLSSIIIKKAKSPVKQWAVEYLAKMKTPRAREILADEYEQNPKGRYLMMQALGNSQNPIMSAILIRGLKDEYSQVRRLAAEALENLPNPAAEGPLIDCLNDPDSSVELAAIKALSKMRSSGAVPALIKSLDSSPVNDEAAKALGKIGDMRAANPLLAILQKPSSPCPPSCPEVFLRAAAAEALGQVGDRQSVPALLNELKGIPPRISRGAAIALGALKDRRAVDPLMEALNYEHCSVRASAAFALGEIGDSRAISALVPHLSDGAIRSSIAAALFKLHWRPKTDRERTFIRLEQQKWNELNAEWAISRSVFLSDLKTEDPDIVQSAAFVLITMGAGDALAELVSALHNGGTYLMGVVYYNSGQPQLRMAAIEWAFHEGRDYLELGSEEPILVWGGHDLARVGCSMEAY